MMASMSATGCSAVDLPMSSGSSTSLLTTPKRPGTKKAHAICMVCAWSVHGLCMVCAWHVHGMCMACARLQAVEARVKGDERHR